MIIFAALKSRADQITICELSQAIEQKKKKVSGPTQAEWECGGIFLWSQSCLSKMGSVFDVGFISSSKECLMFPGFWAFLYDRKIVKNNKK